MNSLKCGFIVDLPSGSSILFTKISKVFRPKLSPNSSVSCSPLLREATAQPCEDGTEITFPIGVIDGCCPTPPSALMPLMGHNMARALVEDRTREQERQKNGFLYFQLLVLSCSQARRELSVLRRACPK